MTEPAAGTARRDFLRRRRRVLGGTSLILATLAALAALLLAPNRLASVRLGEVALAWWAMGAVALIALIAVSRGLRESDPADASGGRTSWVLPLALALVWGSPALWLGLPPLLLGDGIRGLWPAAVVIGGAVLAMLLLETRLTRADDSVARTSGVAAARWPSAGGCRALLGSIEMLVAALFVWAQLAAVRELAAMIGWPRAATIGAVVLVALGALLPDLFRARLAALAGGLALVGLAAPLVLVALHTTTGWPGVWSAVASRPRIAFIEGTAWTLEGGAVRGPGAPPTMRFVDEQRIAFAAPGTVVMEPREGTRFARDVRLGEEVSVHPGDRLIVPDGMHLRFEPGRRVPDAPDSGPAWVEPPARSTGWLGLVTLGVTGLLGVLGLPAGVIRGGAGRLAPRRAAQLAVGLVMAGAALALGWSLYAVWLTPEVYAAGVAGIEVYALPASMARLGGWGSLLAALALGGLALGGGAAALAGLQGLAATENPASAAHWTRRRAALLVLGLGLLACLVPAGSWALLVLALGVAASALAPAALLAGWSERATPGGVAAGAAVGLLTFLVVALAGVVSPGGPEDAWRMAITTGPATVAVPAHLLVAWLLRLRRPAAQRLPPGFGGAAAMPPPQTS